MKIFNTVSPNFLTWQSIYFVVYFQSHIEKGNDLLEEAGALAQSGDFEEVTGYKDLAKMLKRHLQEFSERLEETRERIEGATRCYQLLDKVRNVWNNIFDLITALTP